MTQETYFLIRCDEDGIFISNLPAEDVLNEIHEEIEDGCQDKMEFLDKIPDIDKGYFCNTKTNRPAILIKGKIIIPKPVKEIVQYRLEE